VIQAARSRRGDPLTLWAADYLRRNPDATLEQMLEAALQRRYSASPYEQFFTRSGVQRFNNFRKDDNNRIVTVQQALQEPINQPYIRLLRVVIRYCMHQREEDAVSLLTNDRDQPRRAYLYTCCDPGVRAFLPC